MPDDERTLQAMAYPHHHHDLLHTHHFIHQRQQTDRPCDHPDGCDGVLRVQSAYAPDVGVNWEECCCCGREGVGSHVRVQGKVHRGRL